MPSDEFKAALKANGVKWAWTAQGRLRFYLRTSEPKTMPDGTRWNGTERIGEYVGWDNARECGYLADYAKQAQAERAEA
jgi:hypothetical protein